MKLINYSLTMVIRFSIPSLLMFVLVIMAGCSAGPRAEQKDISTIFYPPLPNKPKIQYLTTINAAQIQKSKRTDFSDYVLGKDESKGSRINKPYGVAYDGKNVFVVDTRAPGYMILSADDKLIKAVNGSGGGRMTKPINISLDREGNRYVTDTGRDQILIYDKNDNFIRAFGVKDQFKPADALVSGDKLYVTDIKNHLIQVLDKNTGRVLKKISEAGSKDGQLIFPTNLAMDPQGNILVSDSGNYRVQSFDPNGKFIKSYGRAGNGLGQFARPKGIAVDHSGNIYVIDAAFENVQVFNSSGKLLLFFGSPGNNPDSMNLPADISIQYEGVDKFQKYVDPGFKVEYLIFVSNQFGPNKIGVYGYGAQKNSVEGIAINTK